MINYLACKLFSYHSYNVVTLILHMLTFSKVFSWTLNLKTYIVIYIKFAMYCDFHKIG